MEQHPIPRNVSGFQFQLVGSMTLKQFGYLAGGLALAFIFFKGPFSFLRYPLATFSALLGFALAFLPVQERSLDVWILNFLKNVYSPTQFIWEKENQPPEFLIQSFTPQKKTAQASTPAEKHQEAREKLSVYLQSLAPREHEVLDEQEKAVLGQISSLFGQKIAGEVPGTNLSTSPSLISGLVKVEDTLLSNILINIKDKSGRVVRLLKSDERGKFSSKLPLAPGVYSVEIEDPGNKYAFSGFSFKINGEVIKPWLIKPIQVLTN